MDALTEGSPASDADVEMTALTAEDVTERHPDDGDEVEHLQNSLREAVHDDGVRPMMQCLMMDSSFSMVTMQGEDSGIAWETTSSHGATPWSSEAGNPGVDLGSLVAVRPATPGSGPAGKIIFVMDEELLSRRRKPKERVSGQKSKADRHREVFEQSSEDISGRPELVGVSQPNVKAEEGAEEEPNDPPVNKEQRLFSLVSEGSEILNIVVPPKFYTVDEEKSKGMVDNLSYLEESPVPAASHETNDHESVFSTGVEQVKPSPSDVMDPPGAPVARPLGVGAAGNVDYFEAYSLIDAQAPGGPAVVVPGQVGQEARVDTDSQDTEKLQSKDNATTETTTTTTTVDKDESDTVSLGEIPCQLLDDVFYGGTENYQKGLSREDGVADGAPPRVPVKLSGSTLFGSQEDILTPIFLPEGPPKIIDPILLEEPKAMAFLYTDLYEEAIGSRQKDEDAESVASEKSFHSRHSDREARGYLEKYVLIDETPVVEVEQTDGGECPQEGPRVLSQDLYEFCDFLPKPEISEMPSSEEDVTDFLMSSAGSSPRDKEPFVRSLEDDEDEAQTTTKTKDKTDKNVSIKIENVAEIPADPLSISSFEFPSEETDWGSPDDYTLDEKHEHTEVWEQLPEVQKPVAPPRRKATSSPKACLDLTPLIPIDAIQETEESGGNEQMEEEGEMASEAETVKEGGGERAMQTSCNDASESAFAVESAQTESVNDGDNINTKPAAAEGKDAETVEDQEMSKAEAATKEAESEEVDVKSSESAKTEGHPEKHRESSTASPSEPAKDKGRCVIL